MKLHINMALLACATTIAFTACDKKEDPVDETGAVTPAEARAIAKEAYIYGYSVVDNYRIQYAYFGLPGNPEYKGGYNEIINTPRVFTPEDTAIQTPNSDTPYSFLGADLRAEPLVISVPEIEKERYYSIQFMDEYTYNFAYAGTRTTGNDAGKFLLAGPNWKGETPEGIKKVVRSETELVFAAYRTQLFNPADIDKVKAIQAGYKVQGLSAFLGKPAPAAAPKIDWIQPVKPDAAKTPLDFFGVLNFALKFCPTVPSEVDLMARFAKIGVGAGLEFDAAKLSPELKQAIQEGIADGWAAYEDLQTNEIDTGKVTTAMLFGSREVLKNNYLYRMAGTINGIYGNSEMEAIYPMYRLDSDGKNLDATSNKYTLHFDKGQFPPANAFWSVTMYNLPESLLSANPINRYLINSPMLPNMTLDADGGLTIYIQHESPGAEMESNWLPAPKGPFWAAMRLYWPKEVALDGTWVAPKMEMVK